MLLEQYFINKDFLVGANSGRQAFKKEAMSVSKRPINFCTFSAPLILGYSACFVIQGDTKKTVITKNRKTSKILFRLTQNFSYIRSSLCSRHLQSFTSVLQKLFVSLALKKCAPNELPGAAGTFGSGGQSSR